MRIIQGIKRIFKPFVDFPTWMGYRTLVDNGKSVIQSTKNLFTPPEPTQAETFDEAISRLGLTKKEIASREKIFLALCIFWGLLTLGAFTYAIWLFLNGSFKGGLLALALTFLSASLSFRYHFWYFQVKHRLLGANFKLWLHTLLGIKK